MGYSAPYIMLHREVMQAIKTEPTLKILAQPSEVLSAEARRGRTGNGIKRALKVWYKHWCRAKLHLQDSTQAGNYWQSANDDGCSRDSDCELSSSEADALEDFD